MELNKSGASFLPVSWLIALLVVPSLFHGLMGATSFAAGLIAVVGCLLMLTQKAYFPSVALIVFLAALIFHTAISFIVFGVEHKSLASLLVLCFIFVSAYFTARYIFFRNHLYQKLDKALVVAFCFFIFIGYLSYFSKFEIGRYFYNNHKPVFPFMEPSHYALAIAPLYIFILSWQRSLLVKLLVFFILLFLGVLIESFLLVVIATSGFFLFSVKGVLKWPLFVLGAIFLYAFIFNNPYYYDRVNLSVDSGNLTALVFLQGLQDAYYAFINTSGFGIGFQMLGYQPPSEAHYRIVEILGRGENHPGLNRYDGGFLAAKVMAEFGVVGVLFSLLYLRYLCLSFFFLSRISVTSLGGNKAVLTFMMACIFSFSYEFFIRGVGYFSPIVFLFFVALFYLKKSKLI